MTYSEAVSTRDRIGYGANTARPGKSRRRLAALSTLQHACYPFGWVPALAHVNEATHDIAYHMVQKGVGSQIHTDHAALLLYIQCSQGFDGRFCLTFGGAEGAEIMLPQQVLRTFAHLGHVQVLMKPARLAVLQRAAHGPAIQVIAVAACLRGKARMKSVIHRVRPQYRHTGWQQGIDTSHPRSYWSQRLRIEVYNLLYGMHSSIRPPCCNDCARSPPPETSKSVVK